jgi:hypothetical protein
MYIGEFWHHIDLIVMARYSVQRRGGSEEVLALLIGELLDCQEECLSIGLALLLVPFSEVE